MDTGSVTEPAEPAEIATLVLYVPSVIPLRFAERESVRLDLPGTDPDVAPSANQPAFSLAVHDNDASPVFVSVTELVVMLVPKSTLSGETESCASEVPVEEGTVSDTDTVSEPAPRSPDIVTFVLYVPAGSDARSAESGMVRLEFPQMVPEDAPSESHLALSLADQENALLVGFDSVTEAALPLLPKSTCPGDTRSLLDFPASVPTSVGEEELQAAEATTRTVVRVANRTRVRQRCTAGLLWMCVDWMEAKRGTTAPCHQVARKGSQ
jgi:hypothetical protein